MVDVQQKVSISVCWSFSTYITTTVRVKQVVNIWSLFEPNIMYLMFIWVQHMQQAAGLIEPSHPLYLFSVE